MGKTEKTGQAKATQGREEQKVKKHLFGLRNKITICFLVPVFFMIVIGLTAYNKAAEGMENNFRSSTIQTLNMAIEYMEMSCDFVEAESTKYLFDSGLSSYCAGYSKNDASERKTVMDNVKNSMISAKVSNPFISHIHILTTSDLTMMSTKASEEKGVLEDYMETMADEDGKLAKWIDRHTLLDSHLTMSGEDYILAYQVLFQNKKGCVVIDVSQSSVREFIEGLQLSENSIVGLVTEGGREIVFENIEEGQESSIAEGEPVFCGRDFMPADSDEAYGYKDVKYNGKDCLFLYSRSEDVGITICALVPQSVVTGQAEDIKGITVMLVVVAGVIVLLVGIFIVMGIQKNMNGISHKFGEVAKGDLTVQVTAQGKDEFQDLASSATNMIMNTKKLVNKVSNATGQLEESSHEVEQVSGVISDYSKDITNAIRDINEGMVRQSTHAQECVDKTEVLSNEIQGVARTIESVERLVNETEEMINHGMDIIRTLGDRAQETTEITAKVGESIASLKEESEIINTFVETITDISEQTNLLSLNASIEAARAGEAGRGFAVVAEEIRHLADDSAKAAGEIRNNVEHISAQTMNSVESANNARSMVALQTEAVEEVVKVFRTMQQRMGDLVSGLGEIVAGIDSADRERADTMHAVMSITDIIEETANNAEAVNEVADKLLNNVENLNRTADALGDNMNELKSEISVFKI
ncbi:MAG: methyl-accepting chemotaxis protein [Butyrivibrio sp.]|nr:methyl-accepting chemotaxis protein [Muribaculum sp.]MCM1553541.1 methyl-accepting chemotaxis protein [Butyrivibrio sp.]